MQLIPVVVFLVLGYAVGTWTERRHFRSLWRREQQFADIGIVNLKNVQQPENVEHAALVTGDAVIATDYFKGFLAKLRNIVGGEVKSYQTLMIRARREATLRLLQRARDLGATEIWNVRYETSNIRGVTGRNPAISVEVFAFGTAVVRR
jgi:uncharacterized protein YbjQ (UPF0145 family)